MYTNIYELWLLFYNENMLLPLKSKWHPTQSLFNRTNILDVYDMFYGCKISKSHAQRKPLYILLTVILMPLPHLLHTRTCSVKHILHVFWYPLPNTPYGNHRFTTPVTPPNPDLFP